MWWVAGKIVGAFHSLQGMEAAPNAPVLGAVLIAIASISASFDAYVRKMGA